MAAPIVRTTTPVKILRSVSGIVPDVVIDEQYHDQLVITSHPVQSGADITDHAYKLPPEVTVTYGWSDSSIANTTLASDFLKTLYAKLLAVQSDISLFDVYTTRRLYKNMLLGAISMTVDKHTETCMLVRMTCKQILLSTVSVLSVPTDPSSLANPASSQPVTQQGILQLQSNNNFNSSAYNSYVGAPNLQVNG